MNERKITVVRAGYREWARRVFQALDEKPGNYASRADVRIAYVDVADDVQLQRYIEQGGAADLALFYGWSWIVPTSFIDAVPSYCLHPSPLPRYRGGAPLQHQIIAGEYWSAVTIFRMTAEILERVAHVAMPLSRQLVFATAEGRAIITREQDHDDKTVMRRRTPAESEITPAEIAKSTARQLADKVRALAHPEYPAAFIVAGDGERLYLWRTSVEGYQ
jgi:methionyl-tRNA formyltransferase